MNRNVPILKKDFVCIIDCKQKNLAAVISSYLSSEDSYFPIFQFPSITSFQKADEVDQYSINHLSHSRATSFSLYAKQAIKRLSHDVTLIIAGLSRDQKEYLSFLNDYNVIEIDAIDQVQFSLECFAPFLISEISCRSSEVLMGLKVAIKSKSRLIIDELAESLSLLENTKSGIVIVEDESSVASVIAINYCLSINCDLLVVQPIPEDEIANFQYLLEAWHEGDLKSYKTLEEKVYERLEDFDFENYKFATFFTDGIPYSLVYKDIIPFTYVNLSWNPDFFIFNNIYRAQFDTNLHSSIIFSPELFVDEETNTVIAILENANCSVTKLIGENSDIYNFDIHLESFPFELLHICSHGGEISGHSIKEEFTDRYGQIHIAEFDSVLSLSKVPDEDLFRAEVQNFYRRFDNLDWRSKELKAKKYPSEVFADMRKAADKPFKERKIISQVNKKITNSRSIKCHDGNFFGGLSALASSLTSPLIFNNTCSSALRISESFISEGARGYLGTLWDVNTDHATEFSEDFYMNLFTGTVSDAIHSARQKLVGTESEAIYIYWGLHFTQLRSTNNKFQNKKVLFYELVKIMKQLLEDYEKASEDKVSRHIERRISWIKKVIAKI